MGRGLDITIEYDRSNPSSIEAYAQRLVGKTFRQIIEEYYAEQKASNDDYDDRVEPGIIDDKKNKGNLGQIIEKYFFYYKPNNDERADFYEAGVELKVSPYRVNHNGTLSAKERLILTMIDYEKVADESFEQSHLWNKSKMILLIYYLYVKEIHIRLDYKIGFSKLFTPPEQDIQIIRQDYDKIVSKIKQGRAHELSEGDTLYLGAVTKSASARARRKQPYSNIPAKPRAFAFKSSYMTFVLNHYIASDKDTYEPIIETDMGISFESYVTDKINRYRGRSVEDLCIEFDISRENKPKSIGALLAYRILGIKNNKAAEFEKANVVVKTIRIENNDRIKESMSFPFFRFKELIKEDWDDSTFGNYLRETRFFFVVYKFDENGILRLSGCQFWNIPYHDLETEVRGVWEKTKQVLGDGLQVTMNNGRMNNNLPKASENRVCHVRPHGRNAEDTDELPDGRVYPKQCFWLNNAYIYDQIDSSIKHD